MIAENESGLNEELEYLWGILIKCQPVLTEDEFNYLKRLAGLSDAPQEVHPANLNLTGTEK